MKRLQTHFWLLVLAGLFPGLRAQNEFSKWYFGFQAGLDFATSPPTLLTNGIINASEGVATICDSGGNLLFYADGGLVINSTHVPMANGIGLSGGGSSTQAVIIVKQPGSNNIYYLFTTDEFGFSNGLRYSIVDMSLAAGLGSVTVMNAPLSTPTCEKQVAVRHCNGKDIWVITHDYNSNQFRSFLLNSSGVVLPPVISPIGEISGGASIVAIGQIKISPDGKKLAMATLSMSVPQSQGTGGFHLFDFNAATGVVSNSLVLVSGSILASSLNTGAYGVEFSADGTKLYGSTSRGSSSSPSPSCALYQWNICAANNSAIVASQYSVTLGAQVVSSLQRAIDGKIYLAAPGLQSLSVINNPNASGAAMNFVLNGLSLAPKLSRNGLPNYINTYARVPSAPFSYTIACRNATFTIPPAPSFSSGCSAVSYALTGYLWNFGEPASGAANSSTLANPVHSYNATGSYSVSLILFNPCSNDTLKQVITSPGPTVSVSGLFNICKGDKHTYTVTGGSSYLWSNNTASATAQLSPTLTTVYSVTGTANGCSSSRQFTVNVAPCVGIEGYGTEAPFRMFPNPVRDMLVVETEGPLHVGVFDLKGKLILEQALGTGHNEINIAGLSNGVYSLQANNEQSVWRGKVIKME